MVHRVDLLSSALVRLHEYAQEYGVAGSISSEIADVEDLVSQPTGPSFE
jgi:hypothetical protein